MMHTLKRCTAVAASPEAFESVETDKMSLQFHNAAAICGVMAGSC